MARKTNIVKIDKTDAKHFLDKNHIQGYCGSSIYLGAIYNEKIVAVMSFTQETKGNWNLSRFASDNSYICQGIGGKIFKYFMKKFQPNVVKSFADRRWTIDEENNIYIQLGFKFDKYTPIEYRYVDPVNPTERIHKFRCRKTPLSKKYGLPLSMTERQMTEVIGFQRVYDCGLIRYIWIK